MNGVSEDFGMEDAVSVGVGVLGGLLVALPRGSCQSGRWWEALENVSEKVEYQVRVCWVEIVFVTGGIEESGV